jgi:methylglyoxal synthase
MNIAISAQDAKKELMVRFCIAYCGVLSRHKLCSTAATGKLVSEATGLNITTFLGSVQGGCEQIASRVSCGEIDMVLFFRDATRPDLMGDSENDLLRLCDLHTIPLATNLATAEVLIHGLERGDLDWRKVGRPVI